MFGQGNYNFYSVVGCNGVVVVDSWDGVLYMKKYIKKTSVKGFDIFDDAVNWALMMFSHYLSPEYCSPTYLKLNRAVFKKHLIQKAF